MANIAMYIPFGFFLGSMLSRFSRKVRATVVATVAIIFSVLIETLQLFLMRGLFEWDDIVSNTFGALIGMGIYWLLEKLLKEKQFSRFVLFIGAAFAVTCLCVFIRGSRIIGVEADMTSSAYCFQVDSSFYQNGELNLSGFTFLYEQTNREPMLTLRTKEEEVKLITSYGLPRPDVNKYFLCDHDYNDCGFTAVGSVRPDTEYEIYIRWPWSPEVSTGVFVNSNSIHYSPSAFFTPPNVNDASDLQEIIENGILRVYRPDFHCWVYQKNWSLYWIAETGFPFEKDGRTLIQYELWTTQMDKLPEKRKENNWFWDNIGGCFEDYEVQGDFGDYRVMKRELPKAYSITSIVTGYYKDGEWIWKNYFRPIYDFNTSGGGE